MTAGAPGNCERAWESTAFEVGRTLAITRRASERGEVMKPKPQLRCMVASATGSSALARRDRPRPSTTAPPRMPSR